MRKLTCLAACLVLMATACADGGAAPRTVLVDYSHDEFASYFLRNFPSAVSVHAGTELVFRQTWTGEPHSVTGGTIVNELMEEVRPFREKFYKGEPIPEDPPKDIEKLEEKVVRAFQEEGGLNQTASQPCFLTKGAPRQDGKPCAEQDQPVFNGEQSYYNSGLIPYEGPQGNEYRVKLANDIKPGSYWFYCNVHGEFQSTEVVVKPSGQDVDSPEDVTRAARREITRAASPLLNLYRDAARNQKISVPTPGGRPVSVEGNFAGITLPAQWDTAINEFIPRRISASAGEKITWNLFGYHTISFGVPRYFPIMTFERNGTVNLNPKLEPPAGGARELKGPPPGGPAPEGPPRPVPFDAGTYDGKGFWSSGRIGSDRSWIEYSMRIEKPGTYRYACLIHPPMVGTVEVT